MKQKDNLSCDNDTKDKLDEISVIRLELMDQLISRKKELENSLREGYFMLGKARYIMGVHSVSMLQIPSDHCNIETLYHTSVSEEPLSEFPSLTNQLYSIHLNQLDTNETPQEGDETTLRKRKAQTDNVVEDKEEDVGSKDENKGDIEPKDDEEETRVNPNPLNWFSALPPQSLRSAQQHFRQAILKSAECATIQSKLNSLKL